MELKRYVLGIEKGIIDTKGTEYYIWERNKLCSGGGGVLDIILKTSDNILDLVEVGDLVELKNDTRIVHLHNQRWLDDFLSKVQEPEEDEFEIKKNITAIYKCQPNGDYKRYEVK